MFLNNFKEVQNIRNALDMFEIIFPDGESRFGIVRRKTNGSTIDFLIWDQENEIFVEEIGKFTYDYRVGFSQ